MANASDLPTQIAPAAAGTETTPQGPERPGVPSDEASAVASAHIPDAASPHSRGTEFLQADPANVDQAAPAGRWAQLRQALVTRGFWVWKAPVIAGTAILAGWAAYGVLFPPREKEVSAAWSESIAKLGILPLYPPQEDFHVGDVWAMAVATANDETAFSTRAVRIGAIDLADKLRQDLGRHPVFVDTPEKKEKAQFLTLPAEARLSEPASEQIPVRFAAFPGIIINRSLVGSAGFNLGGWASGSDGRSDLIEQITIPTAETYGASIVDTFGGYVRWCKDARYRALCHDTAVRQLLSYVDPHILDQKNGKYVYHLQLLIISRVYLMREIEHKVVRTDRRAIAAGNVGGAAGEGPATDTPAGDSAPDKPPLPPAPDNRSRLAANAAAPSDEGAIRGDVGRSSSYEISMPSRVFQRPLVFGYRSMAFVLNPSTPPEEKK